MGLAIQVAAIAANTQARLLIGSLLSQEAGLQCRPSFMLHPRPWRVTPAACLLPSPDFRA
jgi:hypothetical protein